MRNESCFPVIKVAKSRSHAARKLTDEIYIMMRDHDESSRETKAREASIARLRYRNDTITDHNHCRRRRCCCQIESMNNTLQLACKRRDSFLSRLTTYIMYCKHTRYLLGDPSGCYSGINRNIEKP